MWWLPAKSVFSVETSRDRELNRCRNERLSCHALIQVQAHLLRRVVPSYVGTDSWSSICFAAGTLAHGFSATGYDLNQYGNTELDIVDAHASTHTQRHTHMYVREHLRDLQVVEVQTWLLLKCLHVHIFACLSFLLTWSLGFVVSMQTSSRGRKLQTRDEVKAIGNKSRSACEQRGVGMQTVVTSFESLSSPR